MKRIIIADDSETARMFIRRCLEIAGCRDAEFVEAANGVEALAALEGGATDLLVTDLTMPVVDGTELLKRVRADARFGDLPILVITSANNPAKERELKALKADKILSKPISPPIMVEAIDSLGVKMEES